MSTDGEPPAVVTWHHGLVARWWANFNLDGPEIEYFGELVAVGQPALDAACGTGRLLVPWVTRGLDVDGVDASADMIAACREAAKQADRTPQLFVQPIHQLDLPRQYSTIVMCGGFGLGGTRHQDVEGLRRMFAHLHPGGLLALDYEVEDIDDERWSIVPRPPSSAGPPGAARRRHGADGFDYALRHHVVEIDRTDRHVTRELEAWQWLDGELTAHEVHRLEINGWRAAEIVAALGDVGFADVTVVAGYTGGEPMGDERFLVYLARRPSA